MAFAHPPLSRFPRIVPALGTHPSGQKAPSKDAPIVMVATRNIRQRASALMPFTSATVLNEKIIVRHQSGAVDSRQRPLLEGNSCEVLLMDDTIQLFQLYRISFRIILKHIDYMWFYIGFVVL